MMVLSRSMETTAFSVGHSFSKDKSCLAKRQYLRSTVLWIPTQFHSILRVVKFGLSEGTVPEKGRDISMLCEVEISAEDGILTLKILKGDTHIADCFMNAGNTPCSKVQSVSTRYTFTNNQPSVIISITNLQIADGGNWYCGFQTTSNKLFTFIIYSSPDSVVLSGSHGPEDLSIKGVDFTCKTSNCIYPAPLNYQWFYKSGDTWILYQNSSPTHSDTKCSGNEKVYHSTLSLERNTLWPLHPVNADITVKFQCRLDFPTLTSPLQSADSHSVRYAVQVTSVTLNDGNKTLSSSETIVMINGSSKTFTYATGTSRPVSTIVWYVGSTSVQRSTSTAFTYTAALTDNNTTLCCKAFNIQDEANAVSSTTPSFRILGSPRPLRQVFHNVTSSLGIPVRLSFIAIAYPEPGPKGFSWSKEDRHNWVSLLSNEDFQISSSGLETNFTILNVSQEHYGKYRVTTVNRIGSYDQIMFLSETSQTVPIQTVEMINPMNNVVTIQQNIETVFICRTSEGKPKATVRWYKDKRTATTNDDIETTTFATATETTIGDLIYVTSTLRFSPAKEDNGMKIYCTAINFANNLTSSGKPQLNVQYSPDGPPVIEGFNNTETCYVIENNQSLLSCSSSGGNPQATLSWDCFNSGSTSTSSVESNVTKTVTFTALRGQDRSCTCKSSHPVGRTQSVTVNIEVLYKASIVSFVAQGRVNVSSVTVDENDNVLFVCNIDSNPSSNIEIAFQDKILHRQNMTDTLRYTHKAVTCLESGIYTCTARNQYNFGNDAIAILE